MKTVKKGRGKQKTPVKVSVTIRLDADLVEYLRASGSGWQSRVNDSLRCQYLLAKQFDVCLSTRVH